MLEFIKNETNKTFTENGALTYRSTFSDCLDLFAVAGALRNEPAERIENSFLRAYTENPDIAVKILFFTRDVRGGLGERRVFRIMLRTLAENYPQSVKKNIEYIAEYGRFDDLLTLIDTPCEKYALDFIKSQLETDISALENGGEVSLLAKWLPSVNASNHKTVNQANYIAKYLGMNNAQYRKTLSKLRAKIRIIENNLREKDYTFDYSKQPSKAMFKYREAFIRNDGERYLDFLSNVSSGKVKLNTGTLFPYEIVKPITHSNKIDSDLSLSLNTTWNSLEDYTNGENALVVVDGSGSMYWNGSDTAPIDIALSLGVYFAERNTGEFNNHFITFSQNPKLVEIKGKDIVEKIRYCMTFDEMANTNIQKVFELILNAAVKNNVPQEEMPSTVYIISDMEFDSCANDADITNFKYAKKIFENAGYKLPTLVFWNVASRNENMPVTMNDRGVALVSGCSPRIFSMITSGNLSPYDYMSEVLNSERYANIKA